MPTPDLTELERAVLRVEHAHRHHSHQAVKLQAARDELGISSIRYSQIVNRLLDHPGAEAEFPMLIHRLRRLRDARRITRRAG